MTKIRLSPHARLTFTHDGVQIDAPKGRFELSGADIRVVTLQLIPLLDGSRSEDQLAHALPGITPDSVRSLLALLDGKGALERVAGVTRTASQEAQERYLQSLGLAPGVGSATLAAAHVAIIGLEPLAVLSAVQLAAAGIQQISIYGDPSPTTDLASFIVGLGGRVAHAGIDPLTLVRDAVRSANPECVVQVQPIPATLRRTDMGPVHGFAPVPSLIINAAAPEQLLLRFQVERAAATAGIPSISAHLEGAELWLGPVAHGDAQAACWNCLRMRRLAHREDVMAAHAEQAQLMSGQVVERPHAQLLPMIPAAASLLAVEVIKRASAASPDLVGRVRVHNLLAGTSVLHGIVRMPWCPICGGAQQALDAARSAGVDISGLDSPPITDLPSLYARLEGWLDPVCGVIKSFEGHPAGQPLPRTASVRVANYTEGDPTRVDINLFGGGKGLTDFDAHIGAIGEAIERYSASRYRDSDLRRARIDELDGDVVDPRRLCLYDEQVYQSADNPYVPYDPAMSLDWVRGHWFGTTDPVWVPALAAMFSYRAPASEQLFQVSSSGLAAGASSIDAGLRATFELIERDATMLTWLCQLPGRRLLLDEPPGGPHDTGMAEVIASVRARGVRIEPFVLDLGTGIPTVLCLGFGDGVRAPAVSASLSCHGDLRTATRKALLELAHVTPYLSSISRERVPRTASGVRTLEEHAYFYIPPGREQAFEFLRAGKHEPLSLSSLPPSSFPSDPVAATAVIAERLRAADLKVAIVDLTAPDVLFTPYRVARAVGLDMQPIHFGHHLRRLANPRLHARLGVSGLNPDPHPIA